MTSVPYPSFRMDRPIDGDVNSNSNNNNNFDDTCVGGTSSSRNIRKALVAVGRCRIDCTASYAHDWYLPIVECNRQQAQVEHDSTTAATMTPDEQARNKRLKKKYMKEGVAKAKQFLVEYLQLDVSIIDVEIVLDAADVIATDGCLAACFLDAGCEKIVLAVDDILANAMTDRNGTATSSHESTSTSSSPKDQMAQLLDAAQIPADRLMAHVTLPLVSLTSATLDDGSTITTPNNNNNNGNINHDAYHDAALQQVMDWIRPYCSTVSLHVSRPEDRTAERVFHWIQLCSTSSSTSNSSTNQLDDAETAVTTSTTVSASSSFALQVIVQLDAATVAVSSSDAELALLVGQVSKSLAHQARGTSCIGYGLALVDPTPRQMGLSYAACCKTDREDGLLTTVVCTRNGEALGLVYSSTESIIASLECGRGVYYSRSRQALWRKGDTSGHYQTLHRIDVDCDGDALRFTVTQRGGLADTQQQQQPNQDQQQLASSSMSVVRPAFCHLETLTCWGPPRGLRHLEQVMRDRLYSAPEGSYTKRLFDDPVLLRDKLVEEAQELAEAIEPNHVAEELADVLYFCLARASHAGVYLDDAVSELDRRSRKVTRRPGNSKAFRIAAANTILQQQQQQQKQQQQQQLEAPAGSPNEHL